MGTPPEPINVLDLNGAVAVAPIAIAATASTVPTGFTRTVGAAGTVSLGHKPAGPRWEFDAGVTRVFDDMLERSIPSYHAMRAAVFALGKRYVRPNSHVVDLGCSNGGALEPFVRLFGDECQYVGVEVSDTMLEAARARFAALRSTCAGPRDTISLRKLDLRRDYPAVMASLTLCVLTLQFVPIEYRQRVLQRAYDSTLPGGAVVLVEKVLGETAALNDLLVDAYYDLKRENGYRQEEIDAKRVSLEGVLVPVTAAMNEQLLRATGFRQVECIWRHLNFAAWVAVK